MAQSEEITINVPGMSEEHKAALEARLNAMLKPGFIEDKLAEVIKEKQSRRQAGETVSGKTVREDIERAMSQKFPGNGGDLPRQVVEMLKERLEKTLGRAVRRAEGKSPDEVNRIFEKAIEKVALTHDAMIKTMLFDLSEEGAAARFAQRKAERDARNAEDLEQKKQEAYLPLKNMPWSVFKQAEEVLKKTPEGRELIEMYKKDPNPIHRPPGDVPKAGL